MFSHVIQGDDTHDALANNSPHGTTPTPPPPPPCPYDHLPHNDPPPRHIQTCSLGPHHTVTPVGIPLLAKGARG